MTEIVKYPSLKNVVCPECREKGVVVTQVRTKPMSTNMNWQATLM